jgi:hypothetical protein
LSDAEELKRIAYKLAVLGDGMNVALEGMNAIAQSILTAAQFAEATQSAANAVKDLLIRHSMHRLYADHPNPLNKFGRKCFSQTDEDGITLEIVRRLGVKKGTFAEFGVGDGLENNTIILGALGWRGFWVSADDLAMDIPKSGRLLYIRDWVTLESVSRHTRAGLDFLGADRLDVISLDMDGNDIYFVEDLLKNGFAPKLFIVEYNGKFPPPARFQIAYDPDFSWAMDDYYGAALANFMDLFERHGFRLVCCNSFNGGNAFFVRNDFSHLFGDVPTDINDVYSEICYYMYSSHGHRPCARTVEAVFM